MRDEISVFFEELPALLKRGEEATKLKLEMVEEVTKLRIQTRFLNILNAYIIGTARNKILTPTKAIKEIKKLTAFGKFFIEVEQLGQT